MNKDKLFGPVVVNDRADGAAGIVSMVPPGRTCPRLLCCFCAAFYAAASPAVAEPLVGRVRCVTGAGERPAMTSSTIDVV